MTTIPSAVTILISSLPKLNNSNWFLWSKKMKMVFLAAELPGIVGGSVPTEARDKAAWDRRDMMMLAYLFMAIEEDLQYLVEEEGSASVAMKKLKEHFERSTMSMRIMARRELYGVTHDISKPINHYLQALSATRQKLEALNCKIDDTEFKDILLMHLHPSFHPVRTSLLAQTTEPDLRAVTSILTSSAAADIAIKVEEPDEIVLATRDRGQKTGPVDDRGHRWCDVTNNSSCHRCGRPGHIAAFCMYNMPQTVKDWIMSTRPSPSGSSSSPDSSSHANTAQEQTSIALSYAYDPNSNLGPILL
jgi:hypothetical protein